MRKHLIPYLILLGAFVLAIGCTKNEDPNCQSQTYWADVTLGNSTFNTLTPCGEWSIAIDTATQLIGNTPTAGFYFTRLSNSFRISKGDSTAGLLRFDLFLLAPDTLVTTSIVGTDTIRTLSPENICAILDSNYHRLGSSLSDTSSVITNIRFTNTTDTLESLYVTTNWQISGYGFQPLQIEGVVNGECRTRFEMNALLSDSLATDTIALFGKIRIPLK